MAEVNHGPATGPSGRAWDPRAIRVVLAPAASPDGPGAIVVEPPETPAVAAAPAGSAIPAGEQTLAIAAPDSAASRIVLVDGVPVEADLRLRGPGGPVNRRATLVLGGSARSEHHVLVGAAGPATGAFPGIVRREVVVDGWRFELEIEPAARAALRERASRGRAAASHSGPTEVRAIIPGVVAAVSVAAGDEVSSGQQLLVIEAMKMQNELRAPRGGIIDRVNVGSGSKIDVGDLLVVIT